MSSVDLSKMHGRYRGFSKSARRSAGLELVLQGRMSRKDAAAHVGLNTRTVSRAVSDWCEQYGLDTALVKQGTNAYLLAGQVRTQRETSDEQMGRRWEGTFEEFVDRYFSNHLCEGCMVTHAVPEFHRRMMAELDSGEASGRGGKRLLFQVPPGHGKTTLLSVWYPIYLLSKNPNHRVVVVSKTAGFAKTILSQIKSYLTQEELWDDKEHNLIEDYGPFYDSNKQWTATEIRIAKQEGSIRDPSLRALGVGGHIYGTRADTIVFDDIADNENQRTPERVDNLLSWLTKEVLSRQIGGRGNVLFVGTRVHPQDLYPVLQRNEDMRVVKLAAVLDWNKKTMLWGEHFPWDEFVDKTGPPMSEADQQLIYQQIDIPGASAAFSDAVLDVAKNEQYGYGAVSVCEAQYTVGGVDFAGVGHGSGYTAFVVLGLDMNTSERWVLDAEAFPGITPHALKESVLAWTAKYRVHEWRAEANGLQSHLMQYNREITEPLREMGSRVTPHITGRNKWDAEFGVESMAVLFSEGLVNIPWQGRVAQDRFTELCKQLRGFPQSLPNDLVMALWFAELGARARLERAGVSKYVARPVPRVVAEKREVYEWDTGRYRPPTREELRPASIAVESFPGRGEMSDSGVLVERGMAARTGADGVTMLTPVERTSGGRRIEFTRRQPRLVRASRKR